MKRSIMSGLSLLSLLTVPLDSWGYQLNLPACTTLRGKVQSGNTNAKLPSLHKRTPSLDLELAGGTTFKRDTDWNGNWGGTLVVRESAVTPALDALGSKPNYKITVGTQANVNYNFRTSGQRLSLDPVRMLFMVPISERIMREAQLSLARKVQQTPSMQGQNLNFILSPMIPIRVPVLCIQGNGKSSGFTPERTARVTSEQVRTLKPGVLEHRITCAVTFHLANGRTVPGTYKANTLFTGKGDGLMLAKYSQVTYGPRNEVFGKLNAIGWVRRGYVADQSMAASISSGFSGRPGGQISNSFVPSMFKLPASSFRH